MTMTVRTFHDAVLDLRNRFPRARLEPTASGNLVIRDGGVRRGHFNVRTGAIELVEHSNEVPVVSDQCIDTLNRATVCPVLGEQHDFQQDDSRLKCRWCGDRIPLGALRENDFDSAGVPDEFCTACGCAPGQHPNSTCDEFAGTLPD